MFVIVIPEQVLREILQRIREVRAILRGEEANKDDRRGTF